MATLSSYPKTNDFTGAYLTGFDSSNTVRSFNPLFMPVSSPVQAAIDDAAEDLQDQIDDITSGYLTVSTAASTYQTQAGMSSYLTTSSAATTYQTQSGMSSYLTTATAATTYQPQSGMSAYLTTAAAATTYQTQSGMSSYLTTSAASSTYLTQSNAASTYLTQATAASTYATSSALTTGLSGKVNTSAVGANSGVAPLGSDGKIAATYLPSYVDDVLEYANQAAFPATGETGKIYVTLDTNRTYRWSGSAYVEISASPGSTDAVTEGATNKYFTNQRAIDALSSTLSGYLTTSSASSTYLTQANASTTYLTQSNASTTYATQSSLTTGLAAKANANNAALTGTPTAPTAATADNSTTIATTAYVKANLANYQTTSGMSSYLTTATAASTYQTQAGMSSYLTTATASSTYLTQSNASTTYQTQSGMSSYLTTSTASSTYLTQANASSTYMPKSGGTFTGAITVPSTLTVNAEGAEGGQIVLKAGSNTTMNGDLIIDQTGQVCRIFQSGTNNKGAYIDTGRAANGASSSVAFLSDFSGYATESYVTTRGYITSSALTGYATETYVTTRGYITSSALTGYATQSYVTSQGYITSSALSGYATETYVQNYVSANAAGLRYVLSSSTSQTLAANTVNVDTNNSARSITLNFPTPTDGTITGYVATTDITGISNNGNGASFSGSTPNISLINENKVHLWMASGNAWYLIQ